MAFDAFLKIDGIDGEALNIKYVKWITVESFSWGVTNTGAAAGGGGGGAGKAQAQDLHVLTPSQISSPKLFLAAATGQHFKFAELQVVGRDSQAFIKLRLEDVLVSSFQMSGGSGDALPRDSIALNFAKFTEAVSPRRADGALGAPITTTFNFFDNRTG
jgi:type VI secretion system secreted protein Hcp